MSLILLSKKKRKLKANNNKTFISPTKYITIKDNHTIRLRNDSVKYGRTQQCGKFAQSREIA